MPDDLVLSRDALLQVLATDGPLDSETVRNGWTLWWRESDFEPTAKLLTRYIAQPLSDSDTAWAYIHLANSLAVTEHAAEAVHAHETFERWLPGKSPRLSSTWPLSGAGRLTRSENRPGRVGCNMIDPPGLDADSEPDIGCDRAHLVLLQQSAQTAGYYSGSLCSNR
jgi:hypothetical protein